MKKHFSITIAAMCFAMILSGCFLLNPIPKEYTDGIKVPREYPDDDLEIYDDATVFEVAKDEAEISLTYGTEDDIDDVAKHYEDLFDDNNLTIEEMDDGRGEFYAKGKGEGFIFKIEAEDATGDIEEKLFKTVVHVTVEFEEEPIPDISVQPPEPSETPTPTDAPTEPPIPTETSNDSGYDPNWDKDYVYYMIDPSDITGEELASYIADMPWYYIEYVDSTGIRNNSSGQSTYYSDGTMEYTFDSDTYTGTWEINGNRLNCTYNTGAYTSWEIYLNFSGSTVYMIIMNDEESGAYWLYSISPRGSITTYYTDKDMTAAVKDRCFDSLYYLYYDGSIEAMLPAYMTFFEDFYEGIFEGYLHTGDWQFTDGYIDVSYSGDTDYNGTIYSYAMVDYNSANGKYYLYIADTKAGFEDCYYVYVSR